MTAVSCINVYCTFVQKTISNNFLGSLGDYCPYCAHFLGNRGTARTVEDLSPLMLHHSSTGVDPVIRWKDASGLGSLNPKIGASGIGEGDADDYDDDDDNAQE